MRVNPKGENIMAVSGLWKALGWSQMGHFSRFKHKSTFSYLICNLEDENLRELYLGYL